MSTSPGASTEATETQGSNMPKGSNMKRIATFRRSPSGRLHMTQRTEADRPDGVRGVWAFVQTEGWWDERDRLELRLDGEVLDRWTADTDPMEIDIFRRMIKESLVTPIKRPLP